MASRRVMIAGWVTGAIVALTGFVLILGAHDWQMIDAPTFEIIMVLVACAVVVGIIAKIVASDWLEAFLFSAVLGTPIFLLVRFGYLPAVNAFLDDSPGQQHRLKVRTVHRSKSGFTRRIHIDSWRRDPDGVVIHVDADLTDGSPTHVLLKVHPGALGYEWISDVKAAR